MIALLLLALAQDKYDRAVEGVVFPDADVLREWNRLGDRQERIVAQIVERKHWARGFRLIDEKLGFFVEKPSVEVSIEERSPDGRAARGGGRNGTGAVVFNMARLLEHQKRVDDAAAAEREGKIVRWVVPPLRIEAVVAHELVHVFCGSYEEKWATEGVASYVAGDEVPLYAFNHRGARADSLELLVPEADVYARGMAFFRWIEERWGAEKVKDFAARITHKREKVPAAAAAVTGWAWDRVAVEEKIWSAEWLAKFKPKARSP